MQPFSAISGAELDDRGWSVLSATVERFEAGWKVGAPPELASLVPVPQDPLRARVLVELIKTDQDYRWRAGEHRLVETYLRDWPELGDSPSLLLELLRAECLTRAICDSVPTQCELDSRFPGIGKQIDLATIEAEARAEGTVPAYQNGELAAGARFGRFEIRALKGRGAMGTVYRAYDTHLERDMALKIPRLDHASEPAVLERFLREARAAAAIRPEPYVCPVYDAGQIDGTPFITMPLAEGPSLALWLEGRTVTARQAAELARKLARGLVKVHEVGIVHRDITAANVVIDDAGEPQLLDFSLARPPQKDEGSPGARGLSGTLAYMAPELLRGGAVTPDGRSDIYSLGVLLYQMLTNELPFAGPVPEVHTQILQSEPPTPRQLRPDVDQALEAICLKAMAKRPEDRYQSAAEFAAALERYLRPHDPIPVHRPPRRRAVWIGVAAVVLFAAATIIYLVNRPTSKDESSLEDRLRRAQSGRVLDLGPAFGVNVPGTIGRAGQRDWFQVHAVRDGNLKVCAGNIGSPLHPAVTVYGAELKPILSTDNPPGADAQVIFHVRAKQLVYIEVSGADDSTGGYGLLVCQPKPPLNDFDDLPSARYEAYLLRFDPKGEVMIRGAIHPAGDEDWFTFTAIRRGRLLIRLETPKSSLDPHLQLYDAETLVEERHDEINRNVRAGEKLWLKVRAGSEKGSDDIRPGEDSTGKYELRLRLANAEE